MVKSTTISNKIFHYLLENERYLKVSLMSKTKVNNDIKGKKLLIYKSKQTLLLGNYIK
jgi:hypothetical protein